MKILFSFLFIILSFSSCFKLTTKENYSSSTTVSDSSYSTTVFTWELFDSTKINNNILK